LQNRLSVFILFLILVGSAFAILPIVGRDFSQLLMRPISFARQRTSRNAVGESQKIFSNVEETIREVVQPSDLALVLDNIGIPQGIQSRL
jgi:hypothetical protein